jgi:hypothetical protein
MTFEHEHINPDRFADSAGTPWKGREFEENEWSNDDGSADPKFLDALSAFRRGEISNEQVLDVIREMRLPIWVRVAKVHTVTRLIRVLTSAS